MIIDKIKLDETGVEITGRTDYQDGSYDVHFRLHNTCCYCGEIIPQWEEMICVQVVRNVELRAKSCRRTNCVKKMRSDFSAVVDAIM